MTATIARGTGVDVTDQYGLGRIIGIWAAAAVPMSIMGWVVLPLVAPGPEADPLRFGVMRVVLLTLGLIWEFVLTLIIVRHEEGDLRWSTIRRRLRLQAPRDPATATKKGRVWLWLLPALAGVAILNIFLNSAIESAWGSLLPFFAEPPGYSFDAIFESQEILDGLVGAWWFLALFVVFSIFNTVLGEEFLFRGVLLPKMEGRFGRWSWVANGVLFGLYHLHQPWGIPSAVLDGTLFFAFPAWRFRSTWMAVIVHSAQSVFFAFLILGVVLGVA